MASLEASTPIRVFISYSHRDEAMRRALEKHLSLLWQQEHIVLWHDRKIEPGQEWVPAIDQHLAEAELILLLISADFFASRYCYHVELEQAFQRHAAGVARIIPILVRPVLWEAAPTTVRGLQALPTDARPITEWRNREKAWVDVARGIWRAV